MTVNHIIAVSASGAGYTSKVGAVAKTSIGAIVSGVGENLGLHHAYETALIAQVQIYHPKVGGLERLE